MPDFEIVFARSARKELEAVQPQLAIRILARIESLATDPRPHGCRKLQGAQDLWRIRVADYRVVYAIDDTKRLIDVRVVRHRSDAYR